MDSVVQSMMFTFLYIVLGFVISYVVGAPIFLFTAKLKRRPDGTRIVDRKSWHFEIAHGLSLLFEDSRSYQEKLEQVISKKVGICGYYRKS